MTQQIKSLISKITILGYFLIVGSVVPILWNWSKLPPELPWFYSLPWGEGQLLKKVYFLLVLVSELAIWAGVHFWTYKSKGEEGELLISAMLGIIVSLGLVLVSEIKIMTIFL